MKEIFTLAWQKFRLEVEPDEFRGVPWEEYPDSHGRVTGWVTRGPYKGELELAQDKGATRYYHFDSTLKRAVEEGWSYEGAQGTREENAKEAVERDFKRLKDWCDGKWWYVVLHVTHFRGCECCGQVVDINDRYLVGVESDDEEGTHERSREMARDMLP